MPLRLNWQAPQSILYHLSPGTILFLSQRNFFLCKNHILKIKSVKFQIRFWKMNSFKSMNFSYLYVSVKNIKNGGRVFVSNLPEFYYSFLLITKDSFDRNI